MIPLGASLSYADSQQKKQQNAVESPDSQQKKQQNTVTFGDAPSTQTRSDDSSSGGSGRIGVNVYDSDDAKTQDDIKLYSVSWNCETSSVRIVAGPDVTSLHAYVRTGSYGVTEAVHAPEEMLEGRKVFASSIKWGESYLGVQLIDISGSILQTRSESINITGCTGERTFDKYVQPESTLPSAVTQTEEEGAATQRTEDAPIIAGQETIFDSPLHQQLKGDIPADMVQCNEGLVLVLKPNMEESACVKELTAHKLVMRGWIYTR